MIDLYCERTDPGFWAEPFNALTNLAFLIAAYFAWRYAVSRGAAVPRVNLLVALLAAIGVGSFLFHTFANAVTQALDVAPIVVFQLTYLWVYGGDVMRLGWRGQVAAVNLLLLLLLIASASLGGIANGSLTYLPALLALIVLGDFHRRLVVAKRYVLLTAAGLFVVSLILRTIDPLLCADIPIGTHLWWHLLNSLVLYLAMRGLIDASSVRRNRGA